jgi:hypothetical protein
VPRQPSRRAFLVGCSALVVASVATGAGFGLQSRADLFDPDRAPGFVDFNGWMLTPADKRRIGELLPAAGFEVLDNVELRGMTIRSKRVRSLDECVALCRNADDCASFTLGPGRPVNREMRHSCWQKGGVPDVAEANGFVSGIKRPLLPDR